MCKSLVEKGDLDKPLIIFNRTQKRATDLNAMLPSGKLVVASSLEEAVSKGDIIFTCLGDDAAIKDTIVTALKGDVKGKLFVDCSTVHPDTTNMLAKSIQAQGAEMVACPGMTWRRYVDIEWFVDALLQSLAPPQWLRMANLFVFLPVLQALLRT